MKKKPLPPRARRMNHQARLWSARTWLKKYNGKNIAYGYRKHFGVDWACAFKELEILGIKIDPGYVKNVLKSVEARIAARQRKQAQLEESSKSKQGLIEQDENFSYIAGYTPGGFPYGTTWEEWEEME